MSFYPGYKINGVGGHKVELIREVVDGEVYARPDATTEELSNKLKCLWIAKVDGVEMVVCIDGVPKNA